MRSRNYKNYGEGLSSPIVLLEALFRCHGAHVYNSIILKWRFNTAGCGFIAFRCFIILRKICQETLSIITVIRTKNSPHLFFERTIYFCNVQLLGPHIAFFPECGQLELFYFILNISLNFL